ncbi:MAG: N-acetyl-gamma-glutamyl-phosphate reductase [Phenylobacterium sp.]|uniref:N-acetyl-gamma-glutamyl-phosphate reductase n=1 Tax=Phenylobacterium sp. TaxID=1871053 RepID=UPI0027325364|nr:N-acetyl-gamma-glutamyl-phosphate reductase [Phenylobacterium sp.]MDP1641251.1 N-acetyl-gamma-glutamyl-phosphate reductase [Phenylobacterium sp.]MDP3117251.1 N-acetyl-gamma-glutamyl-phosphate reductase [Phenylobacterium sp.]
MAHKIFIDGEAGTTGLQIRQRLADRRDLEVVSIDPARRKDAEARAELLNSVDVAILCLPDEGAREAVAMIANPDVRVIDPSTAHRTSAGWAFGFPELSPGQRETIAASKRVTNPGCWSTGFIALVAPLVRAGLIPAEAALSVHGVSGYSGGGKGLIAEFEDAPAPAPSADALRPYGLTLAHKHLPEMVAYTGLTHPPIFSPAVGRYAQGMIVEVPLALWALPGQPKVSDLSAALSEAYAGETFVTVATDLEVASLSQARAGAAGYVQALDPEALNGTNSLKLYVFGDEAKGQARLVAVLDNLGKGASGAAVQNLNLMLGLEEETGLTRA